MRAVHRRKRRLLIVRHALRLQLQLLVLAAGHTARDVEEGGGHVGGRLRASAAAVATTGGRTTGRASERADDSDDGEIARVQQVEARAHNESEMERQRTAADTNVSGRVTPPAATAIEA